MAPGDSQSTSHKKQWAYRHELEKPITIPTLSSKKEPPSANGWGKLFIEGSWKNEAVMKILSYLSYSDRVCITLSSRDFDALGPVALSLDLGNAWESQGAIATAGTKVTKEGCGEASESAHNDGSSELGSLPEKVIPSGEVGRRQEQWEEHIQEVLIRLDRDGHGKKERLCKDCWMFQPTSEEEWYDLMWEHLMRLDDVIGKEEEIELPWVEAYESGEYRNWVRKWCAISSVSGKALNFTINISSASKKGKKPDVDVDTTSSDDETSASDSLMGELKNSAAAHDYNVGYRGYYTTTTEDEEEFDFDATSDENENEDVDDGEREDEVELEFDDYDFD